MWSTALVLVVAVAVIGCRSQTAGNIEDVERDGPVARPPVGRIVGSWMTSRNGRRFEAYRGMRYAQPPVGELRFQPPVPIDHYPEEIDARADGPSCPLVAPDDYPVDEDCLTINVYTPNSNSSSRLPVVFFIHPGGFYSMTGRSDLAGPHYLLDRNLVLVTINYRLAALGFLSTGDALAPGNNGMKDQVLALKWVQRNIAAFGGDPGMVTIAGVSAGSISVMLHMISPMTKGLFHRGIAISGSPFGKEPMPEHQIALAEKQAWILDCPSNSSQAILECLMKKPWRDLGNSYPKFFEYAYDPVGLWKPVVERDFGQQRYLTEEPAVAVAAGRMHAVPLIVGQTTEEFAGLAYPILRNATLLSRFNSDWSNMATTSFELPSRTAKTAAERLRRAYFGDRPLSNDEESTKQLGRIYGDAIVGFPAHRMANLMARHSPKPVWYYEFAYVGNQSHTVDPDTNRPVGAAHHDDMLYLFTLPYRFAAIGAGRESGPDGRAVDRMTAIWYNFARYGSPAARPDTPELSCLHWPKMTPDSRKYLVFGEEFDVKTGLKEDRLRLWEELYPLWV